MAFLFPENMIFFYGRKMKDDISQKILPFCQKSKADLFPKNTPKDDISRITEKDDIHPRKDDIGFLCIFMETFLSVFIYCFPIKKPRKLNL